MGTGFDEEVARQTGMNLNAVSVSRDHKWIVCGAQRGASVWDGDGPGQRLEHRGDCSNGFSPNGERLATAWEYDSIRVFDSHNGDQLITINTTIPSFYPITPLAWSDDGNYISATSVDNKVKSFDVSTGSQLAESPVLDGEAVESIALAGNGKFIATFAGRSISFLDTSTLSQIGTAVEDSGDIRSIALSPHSSHLATGQCEGKITVRDLHNVLPDSYGPFHVSNASMSSTITRVDTPYQATAREEQPTTSSEYDNGPPDIELEARGDDDLLEVWLCPFLFEASPHHDIV